MLRRFMAVAALAALALAACASEEPALEGTPPAESAATGEPTVSFVEPTEGADVPAGDVKVTVAVENFDVVNKLGQPAAEGEGHIHFYIEVKEPDLPTAPGKPAVTQDQNTYHASATTTYTWPDVEAGLHPLCVQLVNNDHTPLEPPVTACVDLKAE